MGRRSKAHIKNITNGEKAIRGEMGRFVRNPRHIISNLLEQIIDDIECNNDIEKDETFFPLSDIDSEIVDCMDSNTEETAINAQSQDSSFANKDLREFKSLFKSFNTDLDKKGPWVKLGISRATYFRLKIKKRKLAEDAAKCIPLYSYFDSSCNSSSISSSNSSNDSDVIIIDDEEGKEEHQYEDTDDELENWKRH
jgi:hypothetical protein